MTYAMPNARHARGFSGTVSSRSVDHADGDNVPRPHDSVLPGVELRPGPTLSSLDNPLSPRLVVLPLLSPLLPPLLPRRGPPRLDDSRLRGDMPPDGSVPVMAETGGVAGPLLFEVVDERA